ncbi:hypothetical protein KIW84_060748 [Lathyrus oleraceus]|uniref:MULE transposase domain-containing protein n=1 Tax=Pisum sativum TaxID=3888 RepID=A0A9D4W0H4_PEA|nr:hypothetical protein KIW84_060748 [Pisum sativum]
MLWSYDVGLRGESKGNTFKLNIARPTLGLPPRFERCYMCFDSIKKALKVACRPFIGLDECHLKSKYGEILLIVIASDASDQYLPIAFGVVENETKGSWIWFVKLLLDDIGCDSRHVVASIHRKVDDPIKYVHKCCHRTTYIASYNEVITLISGQNKWARTSDLEILPPSFKRGLGRPNKLYRREPDEASQARWKRTNIINRVIQKGIPKKEAQRQCEYCGIDLDELATLLNDEDTLDIEPLNVDISPAKPHVPSKQSVNVNLTSFDSTTIRTLKTHGIMGPMRHAEDPFVVPEEEKCWQC